MEIVRRIYNITQEGRENCGNFSARSFFINRNFSYNAVVIIIRAEDLPSKFLNTTGGGNKKKKKLAVGKLIFITPKFG